jgi:thioredoxin 1
MIGRPIRVLAVLSLVLAIGIGATIQAAEKKPTPKAKSSTVSAKPASKKAPAKTSKTARKPVAKKSDPKAKAPKSLPRLLDLGATKCVPCKMMVPVLDELTKEYKGKLRVEFIDVWKDEKAAEKYKVQSIPTQIFFDAKGKEVYRHVGYFPKEDILKTFQDHGIKLVKATDPKKPGK